MRVQPLRKYFLKELRELYRREKRWLIILPEVKRNLSPMDVELAVEQHLEQTAARIIRLEELFSLMALADRGCMRSVRPLLREADEVLIAVTLSCLNARNQPRRMRIARARGGRFFPASCQN